MRRLGIVVAALLAVLAIAAGVFAWQVERFLDGPLQIPVDGIAFEIPAGSSFAAVARRLVDEEIIESDTLYRIYARWSGKASGIQAGDYLLPAGATPRSILEQFTSGDVRLYSFTIVEGWNHRDLLAALHDNSVVTATMTDEDWPALLAELGAVTMHPEGQFLPETYHFPRATSDREILSQAYKLMQQVLAEEWQARNSATTPAGTAYEALILASIVEKETARADERHRIAGVFARRLERRMRLQTDPTVIYGIGPAFDGNLTRAHLRTDTPYNTYTRHGLPPTPIAMPGRAAINSALNPAPGKELYFVATGLGDGSHKFSETKAEHDAAVAEYLRRLRERRRQGS